MNKRLALAIFSMFVLASFASTIHISAWWEEGHQLMTMEAVEVISQALPEWSEFFHHYAYFLNDTATWPDMVFKASDPKEEPRHYYDLEIPPEQRTYSSMIIRKVSAEGRKFGVFLVLITQRPSKIHSDALSQCNSQIIMRITNPEDQRAVSISSERMSRDLLEDLPGLNVGAAVIVGEMTRAPVMVKVKKRRTQEGGSDIDIIGKLKEACTVASKGEKEIQRLRDELKGIYDQRA